MPEPARTLPPMRLAHLLPIYLPLLLASCKEPKDTAAPSAPATAAPPLGMVLIPAGSFEMGLSEERLKAGENPVRSGAEEWPAHKVMLDAFHMDETEVTNAQFKAFVAATGYKTQAERPFKQSDFPKARPQDLEPASFVLSQPVGPINVRTASHWTWWKLTPGADWLHPDGPGSDLEGRSDHPVVNIAYEDAQTYAKWAGKRLPTEAEWEYAARGGLEGKLYPWGDELKPGGKWQANIWQGNFPNDNSKEDGFKTTAPVKSFSPNGYGLFDISGNVWELVADEYEKGYYERSPKHSPTGGEGKSIVSPEEGIQVRQRIIRGGSFLCTEGYCTGYRVAARQLSDDITASHHTGFRCVKDIK